MARRKAAYWLMSDHVPRISRLEQGADFPIAHRLFREAEGAAFSQFAGGAKKRAQSRPGERAADADALHPQLRKCREVQSDALQPHHDVHRTINGTDNGGDLLLISKARCIENIRTRLLIGLEPLDRILKIGPAYEI